jgi:hypothetical protein
MQRRKAAVAVLGAALFSWSAFAEEFTAEQASAALRKAVGFFHGEVATEGGYLWRYSADLVRREGEGKADAQTIWVQPPGTPSVGMALLKAWRSTGDAYYRDAARDAAMALVRGQLRSGGWDHAVYFDERRGKYAYRVEPAGGERNTSSLDDETTQAAVRFLMEMDRALEFKDDVIHEAALYALQAILDAQYPNGAWPQRFTGPPDPAEFPVKPASYPESWSRTHPDADYTRYYTFNDNGIADTIALMFDAARVYDDKRYRDAAIKAADFILLAQMPDPQPAWAQQYNRDMQPAWARRFEPPAVTGGESQGIIGTLIAVYRETGDSKYLDAAERALAYLRKSVLPDGRLARFYELKTNTPLYFTKDYVLTYSDADMPTHYSFKSGNRLDELARELAEARAGKAPGAAGETEPPEAESRGKAARAAAESLDERGAWVEVGRLRYHGDDDPVREVIDCGTFIRNVGALADFIAASR